MVSITCGSCRHLTYFEQRWHCLTSVHLYIYVIVTLNCALYNAIIDAFVM